MVLSLRYSTPRIVLPVAAVATPLAFIAIAALTSSWFSIYDNALSDLGHAVKSPAAPIFNTGLSLGGFLIMLAAVRLLNRRALTIAYIAVGYSLNLVAVFDEVYGDLHFIVSTLFFLSLALVLMVYSVAFHTWTPIPALAVGVTIWVIHFTYSVPRGAAIPELISILIVLPYYIGSFKAVTR